MAFSNTKTALAHSISYEMTLRHGLPHGIACSFSLPYVQGCDPARDQVFETLFGADRQQAQAQLRAFLLSVGVKAEFLDYGVGPEEQEAMISYAMQDARGKNFIVA
ncbi:hypothetical protein [Alcaligenes faecalis]|uniref:hypothetical protein n=1 Tax=Alcaligenes faecalis TaxID=511 RepID=UPI003B97103C